MQYQDEKFRNFQSLRCFARKFLLYWLRKHDIFEPFSSIKSLKRSDLGF